MEAARERLIEAAAESDDELADRYLSGEELTAEEIESALRGAVLRGELVPILATSATENIGVLEFLAMTRSFTPSPVDGAKPRLAKAGSSDEAQYEADAGRAAGRPGLQDHRRPVCRKALTVPGLPGHHQEQLGSVRRQPGAVGTGRAALPAQGQEPGKIWRK